MHSLFPSSTIDTWKETFADQEDLCQCYREDLMGNLALYTNPQRLQHQISGCNMSVLQVIEISVNKS